MTLGGQAFRRPRRRGVSESTAWAWAGCELAACWWPGSGVYRDLVRNRGLTMAGAAVAERHAGTVIGPDMAGSTTGTYASIGSQRFMLAAGSWTIAAHLWSDGEAASQGIIAKGANSEVAGQNHNYWLSYDQGTFTDDQAGNGWLVGFERSDSAGANVTAKYVVANTAGPYLIMGCLDTTAQELRLYVDGILSRTRTTVTTVGETNNIDLTIGRFASNGDTINRWNGVIQAAWLWRNRAFTTGDALRFARDPYAMFREPVPHYLYVAPAPGTGLRSFCAGMIG